MFFFFWTSVSDLIDLDKVIINKRENSIVSEINEKKRGKEFKHVEVTLLSRIGKSNSTRKSQTAK